MNSQSDAELGSSELAVEKPPGTGSADSVQLCGEGSNEPRPDSSLKADDSINVPKDEVIGTEDKGEIALEVEIKGKVGDESSMPVEGDSQTSVKGVGITAELEPVSKDPPINEDAETKEEKASVDEAKGIDATVINPNGEQTNSTSTDTAGEAPTGGRSSQKSGGADASNHTNENEKLTGEEKIQVRGLPKFYNFGELKKFLIARVEIPFRLLKPARKNSPWVIMCFKNEGNRIAAMQKLNRLTWKGNMLIASVGNSGPNANKRKLENEGSGDQNGKKVRVDNEETLRNLITPYWNLPYDEQIEKKREFIKKTMCNLADQIIKVNPMLKTWIGRQKSKHQGMACQLLDIRKSPNCDGYRNKCEFTVGINEETKQRMVGFRLGNHVKGHVAIGPIDSLKHIPQRMKDTVKVFEKFVQGSPREPYNAETRAGYWKQLNLRLSTLDELMAVVIVNSKGETPEEITVVKDEVKAFFESEEGKALKLTSLYFQAVGKREVGKIPPMEHLLGEKHISESLLGLKFRISPETYFEVNTSGAGVLYSAVSELIDASPTTSIIDICCGTGTIGLSLAEKCGQILGVEVVEAAIEDAKANAAQNKIINSEFFAGRAEEILPYVLRSATGTSVYAIVDPPRHGLHPKIIAALREADLIKQVVYISCDPNSALKNFIDLVHKTTKTNRGHPLVPICAIPVDMFPHTLHCEVIILFHRINPSNLPKPIPYEREDIDVVKSSLLQQTNRPKTVDPSKPTEPIKKQTNQPGKNSAVANAPGNKNPGNKSRANSSAALHQVKQDDKFKKTPRKRPPRFVRLLSRGHPIPEGPRGKLMEFHPPPIAGGPRSRNVNVVKGRMGAVRDAGRGRAKFRNEEEFLFTRRSNPPGRGFRERSPQHWSEGPGNSQRMRDDKPGFRGSPRGGGQWGRREMERSGEYHGRVGGNPRRGGWREDEGMGPRGRFSPIPDFRDMRRNDDMHREEEPHWRRDRGRDVVSPRQLDDRNFVRADDRVMILDRNQPLVQQIGMIGRPVVVGDKYGVLLNSSGNPVAGEVLLITSKNQMYDGDGRVWVNSNEGPPKMFIQPKEMALLPKPWEQERRSPPAYIKPSSPMKSHENISGMHVLGRAVDDRPGGGLWFMDNTGDEVPQRWREPERVIMPKTHAIRDAPNIPDADNTGFTFHRRDMDDRLSNPSSASHSGMPSNASKMLEQSFSFRSQGVSNPYGMKQSHEAPSNMEFSRNTSEQTVYRKVSHNTVMPSGGPSTSVELRSSSFSQNISPLMNLNLREPQKQSSMGYMQGEPSHGHMSNMPPGHRMSSEMRSSHTVPESGGSWNAKSMDRGGGGKHWGGGRPGEQVPRQHW